MAQMFLQICRRCPERCRARALAFLIVCVATAASPRSADAQTPPQSSDPVRIALPAVTVTAQKEPDDKQKVPLSVTAVTSETLDAMGAHIVSDAAILAPNT